MLMSPINMKAHLSLYESILLTDTDNIRNTPSQVLTTWVKFVNISIRHYANYVKLVANPAMI
jgi:hypothetical protein